MFYFFLKSSYLLSLLILMELFTNLHAVLFLRTLVMRLRLIQVIYHVQVSSVGHSVVLFLCSIASTSLLKIQIVFSYLEAIMSKICFAF